MSHDLESVAAALVVDGKGILAADEMVPTLTKRFDTLGVQSTEQSRRTYREMLFTVPGAATFIGGVIMQDETIRQKGSDGTQLIRVLSKQGILPGIKVDTGAKPLAGFPGETVTEGLDGLRDRLREYYGMGARFAKWRAVIHISDALPSRACISTNAHALARYAALCQEQDLVPIVEPEVLMDGSHSIERCEEVTGTVLHAVFGALDQQRVWLERMLLKPNMVIAGKECPHQAGVQDVRYAALLASQRARGSTGHRILVGRSGGSGGYCPSECNQPPARAQTMEDQFLLWARTPGSRPRDVAWQGREPGGRPASFIPAGPVQQCRQSREALRRDGDDARRCRQSATPP
jgi:fructose-bisphosphate aldolase, class I